MNFLPAVLTNSGTAARLEAGPVLNFIDGRRDRPDGSALTIGIRPEHVRVDPDGVPLRIDLVEPLGSETLVHGHLAAPGEAAMVIKLAGKAPESEVLTIKFPPGEIHVFDGDTGRRLP
jgi:sn-glycerol 3-phosphate transport system ATP-binding protein